MNVNKPFSIIYEDFKQGMADLINNSSLHPFIIEAVLQNYLIEIKTAAKKQYEFEKIQYENALKEQKETQENNNPI